LENEAPLFAERNDFFHQFGGFWFGHSAASLLEPPRDVKLTALGVRVLLFEMWGGKNRDRDKVCA
jgi:hypothetical protein